MNETIAAILQEFSLDLYRPIIARDLNLGEPLIPRAGNLVKVITGMRRSGKSYRLFQEMDALIAAGIPERRICYFNFDDDRLGPVTPRTGDDLLETFRYLNPEASSEEGLYLFLDELQEMDGWGRWLRRIVDTTRATIYVTGSSSKMLSREISTEFRGRALDFELLPFSFGEVVSQDPSLAAHRDDPAHPSSRQAKLQARLDAYLDKGGFPAVQDLPRPRANALLQSYAQRVVAKDVVERHDLSRPRVASALATRLLGLNARQLSVRKIENDLRSAGLATGRGYLSGLVSYFEEAYLLFQVKEYSRSLSEVTTAQPKIYAIDPGLALANSRAGASDRGQRLEDAVYLELRRKNPSAREGTISTLHTREHGYEVDFVVGDVLDGAPYELIQVTERMDEPKTIERETRALWEAMRESRLDESLIIVGNGPSATYESDAGRITQVPAWKWLLSSNAVAADK